MPEASPIIKLGALSAGCGVIISFLGYAHLNINITDFNQFILFLPLFMLILSFVVLLAILISYVFIRLVDPQLLSMEEKDRKYIEIPFITLFTLS